MPKLSTTSGLHCYLDKDGSPQGWIHTQESTEPVPTMTFEPKVKAACNGKDSFTFQFSAVTQNPLSPQVLTVIFSNGSAESRCVLDAKTIRPAPSRPVVCAHTGRPTFSTAVRRNGQSTPSIMTRILTSLSRPLSRRHPALSRRPRRFAGQSRHRGLRLVTM